MRDSLAALLRRTVSLAAFRKTCCAKRDERFGEALIELHTLWMMESMIGLHSRMLYRIFHSVNKSSPAQIVHSIRNGFAWMLSLPSLANQKNLQPKCSNTTSNWTCRFCRKVHVRVQPRLSSKTMTLSKSMMIVWLFLSDCIRLSWIFTHSGICSYGRWDYRRRRRRLVDRCDDTWPIVWTYSMRHLAWNVIIACAWTSPIRRCEYAERYFIFFHLPETKIISTIFAIAQRKTQTKAKTCYPQWNEKLLFHGTLPSLSQSIHLEIVHNECAGRTSTICRKMLFLDDLCFSSESEQLMPSFGPSYLQLYSDTLPISYFGRLLISLRTEESRDDVDGQSVTPLVLNIPPIIEVHWLIFQKMLNLKSNFAIDRRNSGRLNNSECVARFSQSHSTETYVFRKFELVCDGPIKVLNILCKWLGRPATIEDQKRLGRRRLRPLSWQSMLRMLDRKSKWTMHWFG